MSRETVNMAKNPDKSIDLAPYWDTSIVLHPGFRHK